MKKFYLFFCITAVVSIVQSCDYFNGESTVISGTVAEADSGNAIGNAAVEVIEPEDLRQSATTDSSGRFSFDIDLNNDTGTVTLDVSKTGYEGQQGVVKLNGDTNSENLLIELVSTSGGNNGNDNGNGDNSGDGDEGDQVDTKSGGPASLQLESISSSTVAIRQTGGDEESEFTFAVKDSAGRLVGEGYEVDFSIIRGPGGGTRITPRTGTTNAEGKVTSSIASGDSSGVIKMEASVIRDDLGVIIRSTPVLISVGNGFPQEDNFRVATVRTNFEAWNLIASNESNVTPNVVVASLGDYRNNPVLPGTAVDFSTTAGSVTASAVTDENGIAIVELRPDGSKPTGHPLGTGFATVTARTVDINDNYITSTTDVLFTSRNPSIKLEPQNISIPANGSQNFTVEITDVNGNPIAAGSTINISVSDGLSNTFGSLTLGDYVTADGPSQTGHTRFNFGVSDTNEDEPNEENATISITVTLPSGVTRNASFN